MTSNSERSKSVQESRCYQKNASVKQKEHLLMKTFIVGEKVLLVIFGEFGRTKGHFC